ncbi:aspartic proteinase [Suillus decipiens]|nr:aspartic proteinase [Suillus decipiens]
MFSAALLTLLCFPIAASPVKAGNPPITLPLTSRLNFSNGTNHLLARDRARVQDHRDSNMHEQRSTNVPLINDYVGYTVSVGIGNPPTTYNLILDSGSGITWVRESVYVETSPSFCTGEPVGTTYESGSFSGIEWVDYITVGPGLTVVLQSIGVASEQRDIDADGVLGIGPVATTLGTLKDMPTEPIPTVTNSLRGQGTISQEVLGIFFRPYGGSLAATGGQITFGGTNPGMYDGNIAYTDITNSRRSRKYWGVDQSITYGPEEILGLTAGIVDCGTNFIMIATDAYVKYRLATGAEYDRVTGLLTISEVQFRDLLDLMFHIGEKTYILTADAQIWPRSLNPQVGGREGLIYLVVCDIGTPSGSGLDFYNSYVFMQRFYTVLDTINRRVGFATTSYTYAATNY